MFRNILMKDELLSYLISYDGVCRTAQATPGLLLTFYNPKIPHTQDTESLDQCGKEQRYHEKNSDLKKKQGVQKMLVHSRVFHRRLVPKTQKS